MMRRVWCWWCAAAAAAAVLWCATLAEAGAGHKLPHPGVPGEGNDPAGEGGGGSEGGGGVGGTCGAEQFACADGSRCVPAAWRCDLRVHCLDVSDERDCTWNTTCGPGQFRCALSGMCIAASWRCDGDLDCGPNDASDEDLYMCNKDFKCPSNYARCATPVDGRFQCAPVAAFCDARRDCADGSDEWDICDNFTASQCVTLGCAEGCRPTHEGLVCYCPKGYEPKDGKCVDTDECARSGSCSQRCENTQGGYTCSCLPGFLLRPDNSGVCEAIDDPAEGGLSLIVGTDKGVQRVWPLRAPPPRAAPAPTPPPAPADNATSINAISVRAIDFHYTNKTVCYVHHNLTRSALVCANASDLSRRRTLPAPRLFPDLDSVSYLRIDWISNNWYFADEHRGAIYVCDSSLASCRLLLERDLSRVQGLALDPALGQMFWCVWGGSAPGVETAALWGGRRRALVRHKLVYPGGLALDRAARRMYWADAYLDTVESADYRGGDRHTIARSYRALHVHQLGVLGGVVFAPAWQQRGVLALEAGGRRWTAAALPHRPAAATVYHRQAQPLVEHPCSKNKGRCSQLCVTAYRNDTPHAHCLCRHGYRLVGHGDCVLVEPESYLVVARGSPAMVQTLALAGGAQLDAAAPVTDLTRPSTADLDPSTGRIYYCDVHRYEIVSQKLDGSEREVFANSEVDNCEGIAIDWMGRNLYWTDHALGRISVARLEAPRVRRVLLDRRRYSPRAIALDPANGLMYWTVWADMRASAANSTGAGGRIERALLDGTNRSVIVDTDLHWPAGLTRHPDRDELYWCDTFLNKIERLILATGKRELLLSNSEATPVLKPYGLAVYEDYVLWTEHDSGALRRWSRDGRVQLVRSFPPPLYDLRLVAAAYRTGENLCSVSNGGCAELCLFTGGGRACACAGGGRPAGDGGRACLNDTRGGAPAPSCDDHQFTCGRGCIDKLYVCDGDADCPDGSDEDASPQGPCANVTCPEEFLRCDNNRCMPRTWVCDGTQDCHDGADEAPAACARTACGPAQFACAASRRCIPAAWRCDGAPDCGPNDPSDEQHCEDTSECSDRMYKCGSGECVPYEYYCDGRADCGDASDELACDPAPTTQAPAPAHTHRPHWKPNNDDKGGLCEEHEFQCKNTECIRKEFWCDSRVDCLDGSDEEECQLATTRAPPPASTPAPAPAPADPCPAPALRCDNGTRCVPLLLQCDERRDCDDGADEAGRCGEPMCEVSGCSHTCRPAPGGPMCACPPPLHLQPDRLTCDPAHPCTRFGACSQKCFPLKRGYKCTCYDGYQLSDDGFTCKSTANATPLLVFSNRHEVRGVELPSLRSRALLSSLKNTIALDWWGGAVDGAPRLYWTDVLDDKIYTGTLHGTALSGIEVVVEQGLANAEGLAVDWIAANLYWVESSLHQIEVARLDGKYRRTLISGDMDSPRAIAVDPRMGYLFWSDWDSAAARIERASLAGRGRRVLVRVGALTGGAWPNGIALDHLAARLYWIDARSDAIHTTTYEGEGYVEVLRGHAALSHPFAITVFEAHVYWTDWRSNSVVRASKWDGSGVAVVQRTLTQPFDIKVIHPSRQPAADVNPCANNGNCSHLCLIDAPARRLCACPHLMRLAADNLTCTVHETVLLIGRRDELRGVDWEAPAHTLAPAVCAPHLAAPAQLQYAAAAGAVFWPEGESGEIKRVNIRGGTPRTLVESGEGPAAGGAGGAGRVLALDWAAGVMYYWAGGALHAADLAGERTVRLPPSLPAPLALAVSPQRGKLYWAVRGAEGEVIQRANCDGTGVVTLLASKDHPDIGGVTSMVVDEASGRLYWVNSATATVQHLDIDADRGAGKLTTMPMEWGARPAALDVYGGEVVWADAAGAGALRACRPDNCTAPRTLLADAGMVMSVRVYDPATQAATRSACSLRHTPCAHLCLPTSANSSECACSAGYTPLGHDCHPVDEVVVYSLSWEVRGVRAEGSGGADADALLPPIPQLTMASAIDYHAEGEWLYWCDGEAGRIWRVRRDGTGRQLLVQQQEPLTAQPYDLIAGVAVDWVGGNMFWSDPRRSVLEVAHLDGSRRYVLLDTSPIAVTELAIDAARGWLFTAGGGRVHRVRLDGSEYRQLTAAQRAHIALDTQNQEVYWAESWEGGVWRMRYDGSRVTRVSPPAGPPGPPGPPGHAPPAPVPRRSIAALTVHNGSLYWLDTNLNQGSVVVAPLTNLSDHRVLADNLGDSLVDILVWSRAAQTLPNGTAAEGGEWNSCGAGAGCEGLCLFDGRRAHCVCPHGERAPDGRSCTPYKSFVLFSRVTKIDSVHDGDAHDLNSPYPPIQDKELMRNAIALAYWYRESLVFYSDIQRGSINAAHFNGSGHRVLLERVGAVEGLVMDGASGTLYWTCASAAAIHAASARDLLALPPRPSPAAPGAAAERPDAFVPPDRSPSARLVRTLLRLGVEDRPRGIDFDPCDRRVYWTNWRKSRPCIERAYASGARRQAVVSSGVLMPNGLALDHAARRLYWADARLDRIERAHYDGSHRQVVTQRSTSHPFDLAVAGDWLYWTDWVTHAVYRTHKLGGEVTALRRDVPRPMGIVVVAPDHQICSSDPCAVLNGGCAEECASTNGSVQCACAGGRQLQPDGRACAPPAGEGAGARGACPPGQWACAEGPCVPADLVCDGVYHCSDESTASDEDLYYCTSRVCPADSVACGAGGRCVPRARLCDGRLDCDDGADEDGCPCPPEQYRCWDNTCVPVSARCDGAAQCPDGSDERGCGARRCAALGPGALPCGPQRPDCYLPAWRCDSHADCLDGADERGCEDEFMTTTMGMVEGYDGDDSGEICGADEFRCGSVRAGPGDGRGGGRGAGRGADGAAVECIPAAWRCDGRADCLDGSDETIHCRHLTVNVSCGADQFPCGGPAGDGGAGVGGGGGGGGACVPLAARCDGERDCPGGADEAGCPCPPGAVRCASASAGCVRAEEVCDGDLDCEDGSDEPPGCTPPVPPPTSAPPPAAAPPARDATDAAETHPLCAGVPGAVYCAGRCVPPEQVCDGRDHCVDGGGGGAGTDEDPIMCSSAASSLGGAAEGSASAAVRAGCGRGRWRCADGACVSVRALCDGVDDCGDFSDERRCNVNECAVMNGGCAHNCTELAVGRGCWCRAGWRRGPAGSCADVDECAEDRPCAHRCRNTIGSFFCTCFDGYELMSDGVTCSPISPVKASLIFTNRYYIRRAALNGSNVQLLAHNLSNAVALDFLWSARCLYWSDVTRLGSAIRRACRPAPDPAAAPAPLPPGPLPPLLTVQDTEHYTEYQLLHGATLQNPDGLAVDWVGGNLYWCDKGTDTIEVSRLDGTHRRVLIRGQLAEPRALALHPARGTLYWSDWGAAAHIGRAGMDGSRRTVLLADGLVWPNALTISYDTDELYFADAREDYIAVADLDGNNVRVLFSRERMPWLRLHHVFALAVWEGRVYWSDWETRSVESCRRRPALRPPYKESNLTVELEAGGALQCATVARTVHKPMDLRLFHPRRQPPQPELTAECERLNCSGLCLLSPGGEGEGGAPRATCACPEHFVVGADGRSCAPNCTGAHFVCRSTLKCIPFWWRCDTQDDCGDGSDEPASCPQFRCEPGQFQCGASHTNTSAGADDANNANAGANVGTNIGSKGASMKTKPEGGKDMRCLHPAHICDGVTHCADGSDEMDCDKFTCLSSQWKCAGNASAGVAARCVPGAVRCDGRRDCPAGDDEAACPPRACPPHHFACTSGECVPLVWVCDEDSDCGDGSDEGALCRGRACGRAEFRCGSGRCIPAEWLCDAEADCPGREDEADCDGRSPPACDPTYFRCGDGRCIPGRWRCDFEDDCADGSDELKCTPRNCSESEFRCGSGECIRGSLRCSGGAECADGSDEAGCSPHCAANARACRRLPVCVPHEWWCDGEADCADGSDEAECGAVTTSPAPSPAGCPAGRLACARCGPAAWRCDGQRDCADGSDEDPAACRLQACAPGMFRCGDNTCLPIHLACDGTVDCGGDPRHNDEEPVYCRLHSSVESPCLPHETLCPDGRCMRDELACDEPEPACTWRTCSQLCLPKHAAHACKCVSGYKQRQLPDGNLTCEYFGPRPWLLVAEGDTIHVWELHKHDLDSPEQGERWRAHNETGVEITSVTSAWIGREQWAWWGDSGGRVRRARLQRAGKDQPPRLLAPETLSTCEGQVRGVALDDVARVLYWTCAGGARAEGAEGGAVYASRLDGTTRVLIYTASDAEPDDLLVHSQAGLLLWSDRGSAPGIMSSELSGQGARTLIRRRVRRPGALAAHAGGWLYWADTRTHSLAVARLDGTGRGTVGLFTPAHAHTNHQENATLLSSRACRRMVTWEEYIWCASGRGLTRLVRRPPPAPAPHPPPSGRTSARSFTAVTLLHAHPSVTEKVKDPCMSAEGVGPCHERALCVRGSGAPGGFLCLCPRHSLLEHLDEDEKCSTEPVDQILGGGKTLPEPEACTLDCGLGKCVRDPPAAGAPPGHEGAPRCRCPALFSGERCQHYVCANYCLHRGRCEPDMHAPVDNTTGQVVLKCICWDGYTGPRCETPPRGPTACGRRTCHNGGVCHAGRCLCQPSYEGESCERCQEGPACGAGEVCARGEGAARCTHRLCVDYCLNQGTCTVSAKGVATCACAAGWGGAQCQMRACVDAACAPGLVPAPAPGPGPAPGHDHDDNRSTHLGGDDHDLLPHHPEAVTGPCSPGECHSGTCVRAAGGGGDGGAGSGGGEGGGRVCSCGGAWGGPRCAHYVGHDHACAALRCPDPMICVWRPTLNPADPGTPYCTCPEGAACAGLGAGAGAGAGAWVASVITVGALVAVLLYILHRRRHGAFVHARLADNVEISNPMYLADDEPEGRGGGAGGAGGGGVALGAAGAPAHANGGNHFANPVYESMYAPQNNATEEQANLLPDVGDGSPPPAERAALL